MDPTPVSRATAEHYRWGGSCDGWHLLRSPSLSVIQERMPPGAQEIRHHHARAQQFFFVLAGELTFELDSRTVRAGPHEGIHIAPGTVHLVRNDGSADATFLVVSEPPSHGDRVIAGGSTSSPGR